MSDPNPPYVPKVGDTVRHPLWKSGSVEVLYVGESQFFGRSDDGEEGCRALDWPWVKVEPTPADRWVIVSVNGDLHDCADDRDARTTAARWNARPDFFEACPWRVARFSFAGWED